MSQPKKTVKQVKAAPGTGSKPERCGRCGDSFGCGVKDKDCWCAGYPPLKNPKKGAGCLCPRCLKDAAGS